MKLAFTCPKCGKRLSADASLAGRGGRCRGCGRRIVVPGPRAPHRPAAAARSSPADADLPDWRTAVASQLVASAGRSAPARAAGAAAAGGRRAASVNSGYSLRPVTPTAVPAISPARSVVELGEPIDPPPEDDFVATLPPITLPDPAQLQAGPSPLLVAYRWFFHELVRLTTWISETSYTVSFIVIILAIASGMAGQHALAQWGTLAVVVLNLVGLAGDVASLVTLSFRKDPLRGALFLVPPFNFYYLWSDWDRYRDAVGRMRIPLMTLAVVVAAYLFVPWLRGGTAGEGAIVAAVERTIGAVEDDFGRPRGFVDEGLKKARGWLRELPHADSQRTSEPAAVDGQDPGGGA